MSVAIILDRPQMGENIGAAARVMKNFGLTDLRLIAPRDGWPNPKADAVAADAVDVLQSATVYETLEQAAADRQVVFALTARSRDLNKPSYTPRDVAQDEQMHSQKIGFLFGRERTGLENPEIAYCNGIMFIPTAPVYPSLNIAQAVAVVAYEWFQANPTDIPEQLDPLATKQELIGFLGHLETELDQRGFFKTPELKPKMLDNLRSIFTRHNLSTQEVQTLRGVISVLTGRKKKD